MILLLAFIHFIADFVFQTRWMAENKSKSLKALLTHVAVYTCTFLALIFWVPAAQLLLFCLITGLLHFVVDFVTSKITAYFWAKGNTHAFFITIGLDQWLHLVCLVLAWGAICYPLWEN